jgi:TPR repeat protein
MALIQRDEGGLPIDNASKRRKAAWLDLVFLALLIGSGIAYISIKREWWLPPEYAYQKGMSLLQKQEGEEGVKKAFSLIERAANAGCVPAEYQLGMMYEEGIGTPKIASEGIKWLFKSATDGSAEGELMLGIKYLEGDDVEKTPEEGARWIEQSAKKGNQQAMVVYGELCAGGKGTTKDPDTAIKGIRASPANAFAIMVFPFPGGPSKMIPRGMRTLNLVYLV